MADLDLDAVESLARSRREYLTRNHLDLILDAVPALTARVRELRESYAAASCRTSELTARVATHEAYIRGANAEVARLRAQVDAVTALCDGSDTIYGMYVRIRDVLAILGAES